MKNGIYVIYDLGAEESSTIFTCKNDVVAKRHYSAAVSQSPIPDEFKKFKKEFE